MLIAEGEVSATEVIDDHLTRAFELNVGLNAFVHLSARSARAEARAVDATRRRGEDLGPLAGVPFSVKDVISVEGMPFTAGSRALAGHMGSEDAPAVAAVRAAGAICVGKTNTPEFALWTLTWNELFGYTANPLPGQQDRSPGGSSGGEAAAVAAGLSAFGLGSDFGGSVRWPAHCTGLSSLRPTPGMIDNSGQLPGSRREGQWRLATGSLQADLQMIGPLTRTVADARLVTRVLSDGRAGVSDVNLDGVLVRWCRGEGTTAVDPAIATAIGTAAGMLGDDLGRPVVEHRPAALLEAVQLFRETRAADPTDDLRRLLGTTRPGPVIGALLEAEQPDSPARIIALRQRAIELRRQMLDQMPDVLLLPVAAIAAPSLTEREFAVCGKTLDPWDLLACCQAISLFGLPAAVTPVGTLTDGRPIGVQVVARPGCDDLALTVAQRIETLVSRTGSGSGRDGRSHMSNTS